MKPNRPFVVDSTKNHITLGWNPCEHLILERKENRKTNEEEPEEEVESRRWYLLERKDQVLGWSRAYIGFKTQTQIGPLKPCDYYEFRLKVKTSQMESEWSDTLFAMTKDDVTPVSQLHRAVESGQMNNVRKMLNQRPSCVDVPNRWGQTPLRLAALKNNTGLMVMLLNGGANLNNFEAGSERTPLMAATAKGHAEAVQTLLDKGSSWNTKDRNGCTALNYAVDNSHLELVRLALEKGADVTSKDKRNWSPLMRGVVLKSSIEVLSCLLEAGGDANETDERQQSILMQAVLSGRPDVVELLLKNGADVNVRNIYGHSAHDMAKNSTNDAIVKMAHLLAEDSELAKQ